MPPANSSERAAGTSGKMVPRRADADDVALGDVPVRAARAATPGRRQQHADLVGTGLSGGCTGNTAGSAVPARDVDMGAGREGRQRVSSAGVSSKPAMLRRGASCGAPAQGKKCGCRVGYSSSRFGLLCQIAGSSRRGTIATGVPDRRCVAKVVDLEGCLGVGEGFADLRCWRNISEMKKRRFFKAEILLPHALVRHLCQTDAPRVPQPAGRHRRGHRRGPVPQRAFRARQRQIRCSTSACR